MAPENLAIRTTFTPVVPVNSQSENPIFSFTSKRNPGSADLLAVFFACGRIANFLDVDKVIRQMQMVCTPPMAANGLLAAIWISRSSTEGGAEKAEF